MMNKMSRSDAGRLGAIKTNKLWLARYEKNPKLCKNCLQKLLYEKRKNKFCGHACSATFNNVGICRNGVSHGLQVCINCDCEIVDKKGNKRKYCSAECKHKHDWHLRKTQIRGTGEESSDIMAKKYLIETRGMQCEVCGIKEWRDKPVPLVMDHIDGHSENNKLTNLRLVCGNCDMQLPTYKSKNKGKGRAFRRLRYAIGKSY